MSMNPQALPANTPYARDSQERLGGPRASNASDTSSPALKALPRPEWLPEAQWPFRAFGLEFDDTTIAVTDVGSGPVLLFVHTGMWSFIWRDVIKLLSKDFRCICFDAPGTGQSASLPASAVNLENAARATKQVIEQLNLQDLTLIVHDLGGPSGLAGASYLSERVRGIVAVNAFAWKPSGAAFRGMLALMGNAAMREFDVLTNVLPKITATSFGVGRHMDEQSRQAFLSGIKQHTCRTFHYYMSSARNSEALYRRVAPALAGRFSGLPLLTIFGERNDPLGFQPRWKSLFPSAEQIVVAKGNHFPMCDDPELVARSIRAWHRQKVAPFLSARQYADIRQLGS